ncbi:MAG: hypothetical protein K0Q78_2820 [Cellvibrio sp.]|jgi:hypothetical protein|nr:hypothetical protein [Cellvibrio sp.]
MEARAIIGRITTRLFCALYKQFPSFVMPRNNTVVIHPLGFLSRALSTGKIIQGLAFILVDANGVGRIILLLKDEIIKYEQ